MYLAFCLTSYVWSVAAALAGVWIADWFHVRDQPCDLRTDCQRLAVCSLIGTGAFLFLLHLTRSPISVVVYLLLFALALKFAYLGENHGFLLIELAAVLAGMVLFGMVAAALGLTGVYVLTAVLFAAGAGWLGKRHRDARRIVATRTLRERETRERIRHDPGYTTVCDRCLFHRPGDGRCQLRLDGEEVHCLTIDSRTYCLSYRSRPGDGP